MLSVQFLPWNFGIQYLNGYNFGRIICGEMASASSFVLEADIVIMTTWCVTFPIHVCRYSILLRVYF